MSEGRAIVPLDHGTASQAAAVAIVPTIHRDTEYVALGLFGGFPMRASERTFQNVVRQILGLCGDATLTKEILNQGRSQCCDERDAVR